MEQDWYKPGGGPLFGVGQEALRSAERSNAVRNRIPKLLEAEDRLSGLQWAASDPEPAPLGAEQRG
jgi:hypothetical protein